MSKVWILNKLKEAKPYNPIITNFDQITTLVNQGIYRARLFNLKPLHHDKLKITLYHIKNKANDKDIEKVDRRIIMIDIESPKSIFHEKMIRSLETN